MTVTRRQLLAAGAAAGAGSAAGCADVVEGALSSAPAAVAGSALEATGYGEHTVEEFPVERSISRFGLERSIEVTNWYAEYDRSVSLGMLGLSRLQASVVSVLTTPQVSFLGRTFNPVGEYSTDELVALIQSRYEELESVERVDEETISILEPRRRSRGTSPGRGWFPPRRRSTSSCRSANPSLTATTS